jgi:hypothetical protein
MRAAMKERLDQNLTEATDELHGDNAGFLRADTGDFRPDAARHRLYHGWPHR